MNRRAFILRFVVFVRKTKYGIEDIKNSLTGNTERERYLQKCGIRL